VGFHVNSVGIHVKTKEHHSTKQAEQPGSKELQSMKFYVK